MKSWKTTTAGIGALLTTLGTTLNQLFDGNPATNPDWNLVLPLILTSLVGIFARDNKVTSEQVQAGKVKDPGANIAGGLGAWLLLGALAIGLTGCATPQRPPSAAEQKYFEIKTNVVEVVTRPAGVSSDQVSSVPPVTNRVEQYDFTPNENAGAVAGTAGAVTSIWSPVAGGVVGVAVAGIFSLWGLLRSKKRETANELTSAELGQIIETGRQLLLKLPDGAKYEAAWKDWMIKHQAQTGVLGQVAELVAVSVDNEKAKGAAQTIVNLIAARSK